MKDIELDVGAAHQRMIRDMGLCGAVSPNGERICILDRDHGPHEWDADAQIETVREAVAFTNYSTSQAVKDKRDVALEALDALASELHELRAYKGRTVADERDYEFAERIFAGWRTRAEEAEAELARSKRIAKAHWDANTELVDQYEAKLTAHVESLKAAEAELGRVKTERDGWLAHIAELEGEA